MNATSIWPMDLLNCILVADREIPYGFHHRNTRSYHKIKTYRETFDDGPGGWYGYADVQGQVTKALEWAPGRLTSRSPWWIDYNHAPPGAGYFHMLFILSTFGPQGEATKDAGGPNRFIAGAYPTDFTCARVTVRSRGELREQGAKVSVLLQAILGLALLISGVVRSAPVDPYVAWMEEEVGFVPLEKQKPEWIKEIKNQAYVRVGDFETLESLANQVDPSKTLVGRMVGFRHYAMDTHYPDYELTDTARKWFRHARNLGFHVGAHFNSKNISTIFPELIERFRPGFRVEGVDENGNEIYESIHNGTLVRCSAAFKPWRDYLIEQMRDAVNAGVDVIYLDESMAPNGKFLIDGVNGIEGIMLLMQEVREAYPEVAIETEQFNPLANRHAAFALSQMPPGHPLSGYIFRRFVKVVPEGWMYTPTAEPLMDAFDSWGYMLPGADPLREKPWMHIARAFQTYDLVPDSRLPRAAVSKYQDHYSHGMMPDLDSPPAGKVQRLFGYRGKNGTTAFFEKHPTRRGLMIYEPEKDPGWAGVWHYGIDSWPELVEPEYTDIPGKLLRYWLIYDEDQLLGLNPKLTYSFNTGKALPPDRFHLTRIPPDFAHHTSMDRRILSQEMGPSLDYFKVFFSGHGRIEMFVPDEYDVYMDGKKLHVDRDARQAVADASATSSEPSVITAFRRLEIPLKGPWTDLPLQTRPYYSGYIERIDSEGFQSAVTGIGIIIGRLPEAKRIRLQGSYEIMSESIGDGNQGTLRINGKELWRAPVEKPPFAQHEFDVDVSTLAGEYVMLEFAVEGEIHAWWRATWSQPRVEEEN